MSATRKPAPSAPYPEHDCPNCERGERVIVPPYSSIVGQAGVHPQGNICRKWMSPRLLNAHGVFQSGAPLQPTASPDRPEECTCENNGDLCEYCQQRENLR